MAGQLMLVNPRKRKRTVRKFRRNPDPPASRKKRRTSAKTKVKRGARKARKAVFSFAKKARRRTSKFVAAARKGGRRTKSYRAKRSQNLKQLISNPGGFIRSTVVPSAVGAVGALALDAAYAYLPIPANIKNGALAPVVKIGTVGLLGAAAAHFAPQKSLKMVHTAVTAAIIITAYSWLKSRVQAAVPQLRLGALQDDGMGYVQAGLYMPSIDSGVGQYVSEYVSGDPLGMRGVETAYSVSEDATDWVS